jgi:membrane protein
MDTIKTFVLKFANDWSLNLAGMIAYSLITALFPILLAILSLVGMVLQVFASADLIDVAQSLSRAFPTTRQGGINITPLLQSLVHITGPLAVVALIGLVWLGSNLFATMENAFSIIFRIRGRALVPQRVMAIGMVLVLTLLLPGSLAAAALVTAGSAEFRTLLPQPMGRALRFVGPLTSLGVLWLLFLVVYMVVPNCKVRFRHAWRGALTAAVLFGLLQVLFPLYFSVLLTGNIRYGAAPAAVLVVIIWVWFFALISVIGAQVTAVAMELKATPYDLAHTLEESYEQHDTQVQTKRTTKPTRLRKPRALMRGRGGQPT